VSRFAAAYQGRFRRRPAEVKGYRALDKPLPPRCREG